MKRKVLLGLFIVFLGVIGVTLWWNNRFAGPRVIISPPNANIRFVSFAEAHQKPWINIQPFGLGPFIFPKAPGAGLHASDDPRFVAGYLEVEDGVSWSWEDKPLWHVPNAPSLRGATMVPLGFPSTRDREKRTLKVGGERVEITVPFDPNQLPARYLPTSFQAGPWKLTARYEISQGQKAVVLIRFDDPHAPRYAKVSYTHSSGSGSMGHESPGDFGVTGEVLPSGEIQVIGEIEEWNAIGPTSPKSQPSYPMRFKLTPTPLTKLQ